MKPVDIYTTAQCTYCKLAKQLLTDKGIAFNELRLDEDTSLREVLDKREPGLRSVPQVFMGDTHIGGYDALVKFAAEGKLDHLLKAETEQDSA